MMPHSIDEVERRAFSKQWKSLYWYGGLALFCTWTGWMCINIDDLTGLIMGWLSLIMAVVLLCFIVIRIKALSDAKRSGLEAHQGVIVKKSIVPNGKSLKYSILLNNDTLIGVEKDHFMRVAEGESVVVKVANQASFIASVTKNASSKRPESKKIKERPFSKQILAALAAARKETVAASEILGTAVAYFFLGAMIAVLPLYSLEIAFDVDWAEPIYEPGKWWIGGLGIAVAIGRHVLAYMQLLKLEREGQMSVFDVEILQIELIDDYLRISVGTGDWIAFEAKNADLFKIGDWLRVEEFELKGEPVSVGIQLMDNRYVRPLYYLPYLEK